MVTPDEGIRIDAHVKADKKLVSARILSTMLRRLDKPEPDGEHMVRVARNLTDCGDGLLNFI